MLKITSLFFCLSLTAVFAQEILKENLTKKHSFYWDFNKIKLQSIGSYYKDPLGETTLKHGKWEYFDEDGNPVETRTYYKDKLHGKVTLKFPNGALRSEGFFQMDKQDSVYREWFESGKIAVEAFYKNDRLFGFKKTYYPDGRQQALEEYIDSTKYLQQFWLPDSLHTQTLTNGNGLATHFYNTGTLKSYYNYKNGLPDGEFVERSIYGYDLLTGSFQEGKKQGEWKYYYYTGDLEKISHYENNQLNGKYEYYYDKNRLNVEGYFKDGEKNGVWTWYTNQGNRDMSGTFKEGRQEGTWTYWYPTGELSYTAQYKNDLKHGSWNYYYKDGSKFKSGEYKDDQKHGKWETWYENGKLLMSGNYLNGKEEGEWLNYWDNGQLKNSTTFKDGKLHGAWLSFYPTGKQKLTGTYKNGMKDKVWTDYFENGSPKDIVTYKVIKKKTKMKYDGNFKGHYLYESVKNGHSESYSDKDFKKTAEGDYKNGEKDGVWTAYYPGAKMAANTQSYKNGQLDGKSKEFDRKGIIISEVDYKEGLKHGKMKIYDKRGKLVLEKKFEYGLEVIEGSGGVFMPGK
ncbi:MAG: toxin-antitoxin system YwqK family antitoxin [Bacteroidota bacterium]